jgi:acetyl esterase/lipase
MSLQLNFLNFITKIFKVNNRYKKTGEEFIEYVNKRQKKVSYPYKKMKRKYNINKKILNDHELFYLEKKNNLNKNKKIILYLPGGGLVFPITLFHWNFIDWMLNKTEFGVYVGLYPLVPKFNVDDVMNWLDLAIEEIMDKHPDFEIILMGDSAGANISLSYSQWKMNKGLKENNNDFLRNIIAISPLINFNLENPEIFKCEKIDNILSTPTLKEIANIYKATHETDIPFISPINGDFEKFNVLMLSGTKDLTNPDTRLMALKFPSIQYFEYLNLPHIFPLFPIPEAKDSKEKILEFINKV